MEFNQHHNQLYHTPSSMYTYFSDQAVKEGLWNGTSMGRGSMDTREEIQIELEKERMREQMVAKEIVRMRDLEAELSREMTMHNGQTMSFEEKYGDVINMGKLNGSANWKPSPPPPPPPPAYASDSRYPEFWNENGSWLHGELQSWEFREGPWG